MTTKHDHKPTQQGKLISQLLQQSTEHTHFSQQDKSKKKEHKISSQSVKIKQNIPQVHPERNDKELQTISMIQSSKEKVKKGLNQMIQQYKQEAQKMMNNHGWDPQKQANIKSHLKKLQKQKQERRARFQQDLKKLQQKKKALDQSNLNTSVDRQQKRASIEKRISKIKERQKKRQEEQSKFVKFYHDFKAAKPKHIVLEEQFNQKMKKEKEDKVTTNKKKLSEMFKPMDREQLQEFDENYMNNKYLAQKQRLQSQLMEKKQFEANQEQLNRLYKGHCHSLVLQELSGQHQKSNQAKEKYKRIREYSQLVKEQYQPRVKSGEENEEQQDQDSDNMMPRTQRGKRVVKDRYLKGQYMGKMVTFQKEALSHSQQLCKGHEYLQYLKSLPKRPKKQEKKMPPMPPLKPKSGVYKVPRPQNPLYRASKRYTSIDTSIREGDSSSAKRVIQFMRFRKDQLNQEQKRLRNMNPKNRSEWQSLQKEFNTELVNNIQQKLSILKNL